jgi:HAMP domain-containing protein
VARFLYARDADIAALSKINPSEEVYKLYVDNKRANVIEKGVWELSSDGGAWVEQMSAKPSVEVKSSNSENNDMNGFHYKPPKHFTYKSIPLYDEITFIDLNGNEIIKAVSAQSPKKYYPLSREKRNVSKRENTYIKAETYFEELKKLKPGQIYVSDVIGVYVGSNYIGMYTPKNIDAASLERGYEIKYDPLNQAFAGMENPNGKRFEGIVRWAMPATDAGGKIIGYVTMALNHDHIMEFVDHITPMDERYKELPNANNGNYAFIWDYQCRSICHPRHHSIVGFDPETGERQIPWLETSIYENWKKSGIEKWTDYVKNIPVFDAQSRNKKPAAELTKKGLVGLDGRYLNNAPQCTGWMDLTREGGSGSFYILWSGLYKLNTAAAIPYYTGQYAPSEANGYSKRGFGFVAIGAGIEYFTSPAVKTEIKLVSAIENSLRKTGEHLVITTLLLIVAVVFIAVWLAWSLVKNISVLIKGISRFSSGERQFRFNVKDKDEFGILADSFNDMADRITESAKNSLSIVSMDLKIVYMNKAALIFVNKTLDEVVGKHYADYGIYDIDSPRSPINALKKGDVEAEILYLDKTKQYLKGKADYLTDKSGKKIGYIIEIVDVTEMVLEKNKIE